MSENYDNFMYRMGLGDRQRFWDNKIQNEATFTGDRAITEQNTNPMVVQQGVVGSMQEMLGSFLLMSMEVLLEEIPRQFVSKGKRVQQPSSLIVTAYLEGANLDVIPTRVELRLEMDPRTLRHITCTVAIDDGVYDPRDYRVDQETFQIDWTSPMQDLIGMVARYLNSRRRGVGPRG